MTETRHESTTEPRLEAPSGHNGDFLKGLVGGALIGAAVGNLCARASQAPGP